MDHALLLSVCIPFAGAGSLIRPALLAITINLSTKRNNYKKAKV